MGPKPLFIFLHGRRDPKAAHRSSPQIDALALREGFVAVYPAAIDGKWNYFTESGSSLSLAGTDIADDIGFLRKLIALLIAEKIADPTRVYVSGNSQGGFLAYSVLCQLSDQVTAVAVTLASMTEAQISACKPIRPVPTLVIAGTSDLVVFYDGWLGADYRLTSVPKRWSFGARNMAAPDKKVAFCRGGSKQIRPERCWSNGPDAQRKARCGSIASMVAGMSCLPSPFRRRKSAANGAFAVRTLRLSRSCGHSSCGLSEWIRNDRKGLH